MADGTSFERSGFTMSSTRPVTLAISTVALVVMSACGGSSTTPAAAPSSSTASSTSSPSASQTAAAPTGPATVQVATTTLGKALTDSRGFTLYKFDKDQGGTSVCYEAQDCAVHWPALLTAGAPKASAGADAAMLGTTKRKEGTTQVTYNKMPLYFYYLDKAPGDVRGQGVFGLWWLVAPDGTLIKTTASPT
jgi:predicted lipoprotein with Yx(FWY)xxD motif